MPLPQKCPLDNTNGCRGRDCHLFHIDWRTGEENCSIGYRYTHKTKGSPHVVEDTYARDVKLRKVEAARKRTEIVEEAPKNLSRQEKIITSETEDVTESISEDREEAKAETMEETANDIAGSDIGKESQVVDEGDKTSKLDSLMDELPENYEEEFWSDERGKT